MRRILKDVKVEAGKWNAEENPAVRTEKNSHSVLVSIKKKRFTFRGVVVYWIQRR